MSPDSWLAVKNNTVGLFEVEAAVGGRLFKPFPIHVPILTPAPLLKQSGAIPPSLGLLARDAQSAAF